MIHPSVNIQGNIVSNEILQKLTEDNCKYQNPMDFGLNKKARIGDEIGDVWKVLRRQWEAFKAKQEKIADDETGFTETRQYWIAHFLGELGYDLIPRAKAEDPALPAINYSCKISEAFPLQIESYRQSLDKRPARGGSSPHARMQEFLNKTDDHLYGIVTNGLYIRLLRDASRLVKLSYLEFNLEKIMEENLYADFAVLYRVLHASRMPQQKGDGEDSIIEYYHLESMAAGTRIRQKLSLAVEKSIVELANGFLQHPANEELRRRLNAPKDAPDKISETQFYQYMLRLIYRILFLSVVEERKLLYPDKLSEDENQLRDIYYRFYSIERFRKLAGNYHFVDKYKQDLWDNLRANFRLFEKEKYGSKLGIKPLGGELFGPDGLGILAECHLGNQGFMDMMLWLNFFEDERKQMVRVNYGDLDVEEFGSVYEGLLEYDPEIKSENEQLFFDFKAGDARARSGSHYTPEELVKPLIKYSLEYIIDDCIKKPHERLNLPKGPRTREQIKSLQEQALLSISVCDVACGSGHILLSAARRIGLALAMVRTGDEQPDPASQRMATRDAIRHCIYGVDLNSLAVELCKVALWLEAHSPGEPLNFLDHRIKCGNSIVGLAHREELEKGIADEAYKTLSGDNKAIATAFRNRNKQERKQQKQLGLFDKAIQKEVNVVVEKFQLFKNLPESNPDEVAKKEKQYRNFENSLERIRLKQLADAQVAQFFIPKTEAKKQYLLTDAEYRNFLRNVNSGMGPIQSNKLAYVDSILPRHRFFHWFIEFPEVFGNGGFDCILGNPPYLGGTKISTHYGERFLNNLKFSYTGAKNRCDLVAYFLRRNIEIINTSGYVALITTNTINETDTRIGGLDWIINFLKAKICFANTNVVWPGKATVTVSLFSITKRDEEGKYNSYLTKIEKGKSNYSFNKYKLQNELIYSLGSKPYGKGFFISNIEKENLPKQEQIYVKPFLTGDDINSQIGGKPSRLIIDVGSFNTQDNVMHNCSNIYKILSKRVMPERLRLDPEKAYNKKFILYWWKFGDERKDFYDILKTMDDCIAINRHTKYVSFWQYSCDIIFSDAVVVLASKTEGLKTQLVSSIFNEWAWQEGSKMGSSTLRFNTSDILDTFPFIKGNLSDSLFYKYLNTCRIIQNKYSLGLTNLFNSHHNPKSHIDTFELKELIIQIDEQIKKNYDWSDIKLKHDFYEMGYLPENDRIRFTIHPDARREILKRLLELNHTIFEEEARKGLHKLEKVEEFFRHKGDEVPKEIILQIKKVEKEKKSAKTKPQKMRGRKKGGEGQGKLFLELKL